MYHQVLHSKDESKSFTEGYCTHKKEGLICDINLGNKYVDLPYPDADKEKLLMKANCLHEFLHSIGFEHEH